MNTPRKVKRVVEGRPTREGAGVNLFRIFGFSDTTDFDPFLLLDHFGSDDPEDYEAGFPWHPHRGIETITYMIKGETAHGDSLGNNGIIGPGDVQWMTAGSGIVHQEMPEGNTDGSLSGFQLWANLPAAHKMCAPKYREIKADEIPIIDTDEGVEIRVIAGSINDVQGPVTDVQIQPEYLDVTLVPNARYVHSISVDHTAFYYVFEGQILGNTDGAKTGEPIKKGSLALLSEGDTVDLKSGPDGARLLLISGRPLREPVAWAGPIVMNTQEELKIAFEEYKTGRFIKKGDQ